MPEPLRVALVLPSLCVGGAERQAVKLCRAIPPDRALLSVHLLRRGLPAPLRADLPAHVVVEQSPFSKRDPRLVAWLAHGLKRECVDVAHSFLWFADAVTALAVGREDTGFAASERGDRSFPYHSRARRVFDRLVTFRRAGAVVANSEFGRRLVTELGAPAARATVIPNGISLSDVDDVAPTDLRARHGWPSAATVIVCVARLVEGKGIPVLLEAVERARSTADIRLVLAGEGPLRGDIEAHCSRRGLSAHVALLGQVTDVVGTLKGADAAALLSEEREHSSNAVLEAMACARPVIATGLGGNLELVRSGVNGWLVAPGDAVGTAAAMLELAADPARAVTLGSRARQIVEDSFTIERVAATYLALWRRLAPAA